MTNTFEPITDTSSSLIQSVLNCGDLIDTKHAFKWKEYPSQVVIKTDNFYYKIYQQPTGYGWFNNVIRQKLAEIYREYGMVWDIQIAETEETTTIIEKRSPIPVFDIDIPSPSYEDIMLGWNETLKLLEKKLHLDIILKQIQNKDSRIKNIKLLREAFIAPNDYGLYNGKIILLDDADFGLYIGDKENNLIYKKNTIIKCLYPEYGEMLFTSHNTFEDIEYMDSVTDKWWLFKKTWKDADKIRTDLFSYKQRFLNDCFKITTTEQKLIDTDRKIYI